MLANINCQVRGKGENIGETTRPDRFLLGLETYQMMRSAIEVVGKFKQP